MKTKDKLQKYLRGHGPKSDLINWANKMSRIGKYKAVELHRWHKYTSLRQRIAMTEELLHLKDNFVTQSGAPLHFISLSKALGLSAVLQPEADPPLAKTAQTGQKYGKKD